MTYGSSRGYYTQTVNPDLTLDRFKKLFQNIGKFEELKGGDYLFQFNAGGFMRLEVETNTSKIKLVNLLYKNNQNPEPVISKFFSYLEESGNIGEIFRKSPYFLEEKIVQEVLYIKETKNKKISSCKEISKIESDTILLPDLHGDVHRHQYLKSAIQNKSIEWVGFEMLPHDMKETVDHYFSADENSSKYKNARKNLVDYYSEHWNQKHGKIITDGEINPYFKLIELAKNKGVQTR